MCPYPPRPGTLSAAIVICVYTLDRWGDILAAVESARRQRKTPDEIVVVVDHAPDLYRRLAVTVPDVTLVENRRQRGLSGARNTGVEVTSTEVVAFLDDDAVAHPEWLEHLCAAYTSDAVAGVGGATLPGWDSTRPDWFPTEFDWTIGCSFTGREPGPVRNLLGGNASFRREVFDTVGGFAEQMGRNSATTRPLGGEETDLCIRATQQRPDWVFVYEPRALIWHRVPDERARFGYFRSRCYAEGLSKAALVGRLGASDGLSTERAYVVNTLIVGVLRGFRDAVRGDLAGLRRAGAIVAGFLTTAAGYARGRLSGGEGRARTMIGR